MFHVRTMFLPLNANGWGCEKCWRLKQLIRPTSKDRLKRESFQIRLETSIFYTPCWRFVLFLNNYFVFVIFCRIFASEALLGNWHCLFSFNIGYTPDFHIGNISNFSSSSISQRFNKFNKFTQFRSNFFCHSF